MDAYSDKESTDPVMDYPRHTYTNRDSTLSNTRSHRLPTSAIKTSSSMSTSNPLVKRSLSHPTTPSYDDDNISDNCGDNMDTIVKENEDGEGGGEGESEGEEEEEEGEDRENTSLNSNTVDLFSSPQPSADSLTIKNNPFKVYQILSIDCNEML